MVGRKREKEKKGRRKGKERMGEERRKKRGRKGRESGGIWKGRKKGRMEEGMEEGREEVMEGGEAGGREGYSCPTSSSHLMGPPSLAERRGAPGEAGWALQPATWPSPRAPLHQLPPAPEARRVRRLTRFSPSRHFSSRAGTGGSGRRTPARGADTAFPKTGGGKAAWMLLGEAGKGGSEVALKVAPREDGGLPL